MNIQQQEQSWGSLFKELALLLFIVFLVRTFGFGLYQVPTGSMETTMLVGERFFADKFTYLFSKPQRGDIISFNDPTFAYSKNPIVRTYQEYVGWPIWPFGPANWTKRVIGIPGDHVKGVIEDGKPVVYVNDKKLDEPYLNKYPLLVVNAEEGVSVKSYDPKISDMDQPFYRIHPQEPVCVRPDIMVGEGITITPERRILKEPGKPISPMSGCSARRNAGWNGTDEYDVTLGQDNYWLMGDNRQGSKDCRVVGPIDGRLIHGKIVFRIWSVDSEESWWIVDLIKHPVDFWSRMRWGRFFQKVN
ncbi:MAG TPA: signal peptidase I [Candidatus Babeliales bacterium]|nr:signal peptidase I [Candidatus Babeliales bacterium]